MGSGLGGMQASILRAISELNALYREREALKEGAWHWKPDMIAQHMMLAEDGDDPARAMWQGKVRHDVEAWGTRRGFYRALGTLEQRELLHKKIVKGSRFYGLSGAGVETLSARKRQ
jgi:hypothetical protein